MVQERSWSPLSLARTKCFLHRRRFQERLHVQEYLRPLPQNFRDYQHLCSTRQAWGTLPSRWPFFARIESATLLSKRPFACRWVYRPVRGNLVHVQSIMNFSLLKLPRAGHDVRLDNNSLSIPFGAWMSVLSTSRAYTPAPGIGLFVEDIEGIHVRIPPPT